jgi:hypothetical protein
MSLELNKLIEIYGFKGLGIAFLVMILSSILKSDWFKKKWSKFIDWTIEWFLNRKNVDEEVRHINESDILNHDIFNYIDFWIYSKVPTIQFSTEYRTIIFKKYLTIYLKSYKKVIQEFINSGSYKNMDQSEFWKNLLSMINRIVYDYEKECSNVGIPDIIINRMKQRNNESIQLTIDLVSNITNSQFYQSDNNFLKLYSILNIILSVLENTISNSESICNSINGQLKGMSIIEGGREIKEP